MEFESYDLDKINNSRQFERYEPESKILKVLELLSPLINQAPSIQSKWEEIWDEQPTIRTIDEAKFEFTLTCEKWCRYLHLHRKEPDPGESHENDENSTKTVN